MDWAGLQPDFAAGREIGGDGGKLLGMAFDRCGDAEPLQERDHCPAFNQPAAREMHVQQADDLAPGHGFRPFAQRAQLPGDIGRADQRADRCAADDVGLDAGRQQGIDDTDVRPAARRAAAEGKTYTMTTWHAWGSRGL